MSAVMNLLKAADRCVSVTARTVSTLALAGIFVMFIANVFVRFVPVYNFTQTDDWIQILLVWMIFPGAMELVRTRGHFVVDVITDRVAGTNFGHCCRLAVTVSELVTYALICWYGIVWVLRAQATFQSIPWLQVRWAYAAIPVSAFFMTIYGVRDLILAVRAFLPAKPAWPRQAHQTVHKCTHGRGSRREPRPFHALNMSFPDFLPLCRHVLALLYTGLNQHCPKTSWRD